MSSQSIQQWQSSPTGSTHITHTYVAQNCDNCIHAIGVSESAVVCISPEQFNIFCFSCWDGVAWICENCMKTPIDGEVIGCEKCGQWTHNGCMHNIDVGAKYICSQCCPENKTTELKSELYDLNKKLQKKHTLVHSLRDEISSLGVVHNKTTDENKRLQHQISKDAIKIEKNQRDFICEQSLNDVLQKESKRLGTELTTQVNDLHKYYGLQVNTLKTTLSNEEKARLQQIESLKAHLKKSDSDYVKLSLGITKYKQNIQKVQIAMNNQKQECSKLKKRLRAEHDDIEKAYKILKKRRIAWDSRFPDQFNTVKQALWVKFKCAKRFVHGQLQLIAKTSRGTKEFTTYEELFKTLSRFK